MDFRLQTILMEQNNYRGEDHIPEWARNEQMERTISMKELTEKPRKNTHPKRLYTQIEETSERWFLYFLVFSMIGWLYEVLVFALEHGYGYVNRGFLFGPWLPVYGFGGVIILFLLRNIRKRTVVFADIDITPVVCFGMISIISTLTELITSYIMEWTTGSWLWDYSNDIPNFQGRIALKSSIRFGIIGLVVLYLVQPALDRLFNKCHKSHPAVCHIANGLVLLLFIGDVVIQMISGGNYAGP